MLETIVNNFDLKVVKVIGSETPQSNTSSIANLPKYFLLTKLRYILTLAKNL